MFLNFHFDCKKNLFWSVKYTCTINCLQSRAPIIIIVIIIIIIVIIIIFIIIVIIIIIMIIIVIIIIIIIIIQEEEELAKMSNEFFVSIVKNLGINQDLLPTSSSETRNVESIIAKFENHPSIVTIPNCFDENSIFPFKEIGKTEK